MNREHAFVRFAGRKKMRTGTQIGEPCEWRRAEQVVFYSELGRIAAVRRAQTGYLLAEISGDDLGELLSDG